MRAQHQAEAQRFWVAVVTRETYEAERLYANETIGVAGADVDTVAGPAHAGDPVALLTATAEPGTALLFGLGVIAGNDLGGNHLADDSLAGDDITGDGGVGSVR